MAGRPPVDTAVLVIWVAGVILSFLPLLRSEIDRRLLARKGRPLRDTAWDDLLGELRQALTISRTVRLCISAEDVVPMTWGILRPVILLPSTASTWSRDRRRIVLLHELAHVKRLDLPLQWMARIACVLYWFHPFVWYGLYRLRIEREEACDDCVLVAGERASDYASELIAIAQGHRATRLVTAVGMARSLRLEGRVCALLDGARSHEPVSRAWSAGSLTAALLLVLCTTSLHPVRRTAAATEGQAAQEPADLTDPAGADRPLPVAATDAIGDPLPEGARLRLGTLRFRHPSIAYGMALSPDGETVVTFDHDHIIAWNANTGQERWRANAREHGLELPYGPAYGVRAIAFAPDSNSFYTPGRNRDLLEWRVTTGRNIAVRERKRPSGVSHSVDLSSDGKLAALGSAEGIVVFSLDGQVLYEIPNNSEGPLGTDRRDRLGFFGHYSIGVFSPDATVLAVVTSDTPDVIRLYHHETGRELGRIPLTARLVRFAFSPDGGRIATTERDSAVRLYDVQTGNEVWSHVVELNNPFENYTSAVAYSPDGTLIAAGATDHVIYLLDAATGQQAGRLTGHRWYPWGLAFADNGRTLFSTGWDGSIRRWDIAARKQLSLPQGVHATGACAASPDGNLLAYVDDAGTIRLASASDGTEQGILALDGTSYSEVAFSPDGLRLAGGGTSGDDVHVAVWNVARKRLLHRWDWRKGNDPHSRVDDLDFTPDGNYLAAAVFRQSTAYVWDLTTGEQTAELQHVEVYGLSFSPDGKTLASAGWDSVVRFWGAPAGDLLREHAITDPRADHLKPDQVGMIDRRMYTVEYSPMGGLLATAHLDGYVRIWNAADMGLRSMTKLQSRIAFGSIEFSPDGRWLATGNARGEVSVLDTRTGEQVVDVGRHDGDVYTVDFGRDSKTLLSGGRDGVCYLWDVRLDRHQRE